MSRIGRPPKPLPDEILAAYLGGESIAALVPLAGMSIPTLKRKLKQAGALRSRSATNTISAKKRPPLPHAFYSDAAASLKYMTREQLWEMYWDPASGYPSLSTIANQLGVHSETLRKQFERHGIIVRTAAEQRRLR